MKTIIRMSGVLLLVCSVVAGFATTGLSAEPIYIALSAPLTGTYAEYGQNFKKAMTIFYRITDNWGKYSMLDVFVVVIISAFIQYDQLVRVETGTAIMPFTLVVFFTMMASKSFDVRLIWEKK